MGREAVPTLAKECHLSGVTFPQSSHPCSLTILSPGHLGFRSAPASLRAAWHGLACCAEGVSSACLLGPASSKLPPPTAVNRASVQCSAHTSGTPRFLEP